MEPLTLGRPCIIDVCHKQQKEGRVKVCMCVSTVCMCVMCEYLHICMCVSVCVYECVKVCVHACA
jgi:hypothetical protein